MEGVVLMKNFFRLVVERISHWEITRKITKILKDYHLRLQKSDGKKKHLIYSGLALALILLAVFALPGKQAPQEARAPRLVKTYTLHTADANSVHTFPGEVRASDKVELAFRVPGTLHEVPVVRGQQVKQGDLLAALDKRDYENTLAQVRGELESQEAALASMKTGRKEDVSALSAQLKAAQARYAEAQLSMKRYVSLLEAGVVSKADYDRVKAEHDVTREEVRVAEENLAKSKAGARPEDMDMQKAKIASLRAQVKAAEDALYDTVLRAPFDGVVAEKFVDNFQSVQKDQMIVSLQDIFTLEVIASIPSRVMLEVDHGQTLSPAQVVEKLSIHARFPALPGQAFPLRFKEVATRGNAQSQTYDAIFLLENPEGRIILPGMGADVLVGTRDDQDEKQRGFAVAASMLDTGDQEKQYIWKVQEENGRYRARKTEISIAGYLEDRLLISGDINEGDRIVTTGFFYLADGDEVGFYVSPEDRGKERSL